MSVVKGGVMTILPNFINIMVSFVGAAVILIMMDWHFVILMVLGGIMSLGLMLLFYIFCGIDTTSVLALIGGTALIAGSCEALAAAILVPPVLAAVSRIGRSPRLHHAK